MWIFSFLQQSQRVDGISSAVLKKNIGAPEAKVVGLASRRAAPGCQIPSQHKAEIDFIEYF